MNSRIISRKKRYHSKQLSLIVHRAIKRTEMTLEIIDGKLFEQKKYAHILRQFNCTRLIQFKVKTTNFSNS